jgi:hypothetical protein
MVAFVPTKADSAVGATKDAVLSAAGGQAVAVSLARAVPIPIIGPFAAPVVGAVLTRLRPPKPTVGFSIAFLQGLSARTAIQSAGISFRVPTDVLQGATPVLLRVIPSVKDSTRIVRSFRLSVKVAGNNLTPNAANTKLLSVEEDVISCRRETSGRDTILTLDQPLKSGEYAIALTAATQDNMAPVGLVWDLRIDEPLLAPAPVSHPSAVTVQQTIRIGQSRSQTITSLGSPEKIVKLGAKEIHYYKDLKVIFVDDKVADIQ